MTRVLVCSTYELGAQPLGCAVPAAVLVDAGHDVRMVDLSVEEFDPSDLSWADAVAFSVPMHTVVRLGLAALEQVRSVRPEIPVAFHGLYAPVAVAPGRFRSGDLVAAGNIEEALLTWAGQARSGSPVATRPHPGVDVRIDIGTARRARDETPLTPLREGLPALDRYARLIGHGEERLVGTVESTTGCNHRCRHCPVPVIYQGRSRKVAAEAVLADIDHLIASGAGHIHFADPDFLNRPEHAQSIVSAVHDRYPDVSFDATIKVTHLLRYGDLLAEFATKGLVFVISAFESTSDVVLALLDKGHTAADLPVAVEALRSLGIEPRPSLLPFTPWTTRRDMIELFDFVARHDLIDNIDPVQYGIRLLLPPGSLLLDKADPVLVRSLGALDPEGIAVTWSAPDPLLDELASAISVRTEHAEEVGEPIVATYEALREMVYNVFGERDAGVPSPVGRRGPHPSMRAKLSESWFCCAEPTARQRAVIGGIS